MRGQVARLEPRGLPITDPVKLFESGEHARIPMGARWRIDEGHGLEAPVSADGSIGLLHRVAGREVDTPRWPPLIGDEHTVKGAQNAVLVARLTPEATQQPQRAVHELDGGDA